MILICGQKVCSFPFCFYPSSVRINPFGQISECPRTTLLLSTGPHNPGLSSEQKKGGKNQPSVLRVIFIPFLERVWKCFKTVKSAEQTKNPNYLSLLFFLSFPFSAALSALFPFLYFRRDKIPIPYVIKCAPPFN